MNTHRQIAVVESSQPGAARLTARDAAHDAGMGEQDIYRVGIVATELATNLLKHATSGELLVRQSSAPPHGELELIAIDRGPGITDVSAALADGHSTAGTQGTGLGAIRRLSDEFEIYSSAAGTVVFARLRGGRAPAPASAGFITGGVSVAVRGEEVCGDAWVVQQRSDVLQALIADGLGHGPQANEAAQAAVTVFESRTFATAPDALTAIHGGVRHTRGAAAAIVELHRRQGIAKFTGVGNISAAILTNGTMRQAVSHNGTLGHEARYFREYTYPWQPGSLLIMYSDGLITHWSLDSYPGLRTRHPAVIAAVLYRDFSRRRDDVTVIVAKEAP
jgi:anti-sigma regulatory factor (Ser/Thr protein kinase)